MSQMRVKRRFEETESSVSASASAFQHPSLSFGCVPLSADTRDADRPKRARQMDDSEMEARGAEHANDIARECFRASHAPRTPNTVDQQRASIFRTQAPFDVSAVIETVPLKRKRSKDSIDETMRTPSKQPMFSHPSQSSLPSPTSAQSQSAQSFSREQVERIVRAALQLQEARLREEFDALLSDRLREQFESFSAFNRDYISRQLQKPTELSYLS